MTLYSYRALTPHGKAERGTLDAASASEAKAILQQRHVFPLEVKPSRPFRLGLEVSFLSGRGASLSVQGLANFTRQFATLLEATIPYDTSLEMIIQQSSDLNFKSVLAEVRGNVVEGAYLADAFAKHPRVFPPMVVSMVRSGEVSGNLSMILHRLADYYDNASRLRAKLASAMVYPIFMVLFSIGVVAFMLTFIVPRITQLFDNFGVILPLPTRILIGLSGLVTDYWWLILIVTALGAWGAVHFLRTERGRLLRDKLDLGIPYWNRLRERMILQRFAQTLATMLKSGIELKDALQVSSEVLDNKLYLQAMERVIFDVQNKGLPLAVALRQSGRFPEDLCQMIAIGEETATLDVMLDNVSNRLSREVSAMMDGAAALLEPVMILAMGAGVGFIVMSILLPMLQLNQLVG
ncbi:MAG: type II secretion system F family protein [SAR324 cluster bacterium]|nr:type II secretion system F family protein [SAR324 cluster bacterium]